jgi:hypothetical protein
VQSDEVTKHGTFNEDGAFLYPGDEWSHAQKEAWLYQKCIDMHTAEDLDAVNLFVNLPLASTLTPLKAMIGSLQRVAISPGDRYFKVVD